MDIKKVKSLKNKIESLTQELNDCVEELSLLIDGDIPETGATDNDMGVQNQLIHLVSRKG
jgi:hypothetical protein